MLTELFKRAHAEQSANLSADEQETQPCIEAVRVLSSPKNAGNEAPVVVVRDLKKLYRHRVTALGGVSFQIQRGEFVAVTGSPGAGKTTLLHILGCLTLPSQGDYWLAGRLMKRLTADELALIRNQRIGFVFREPDLLKRVSVLKNVALPLLYAGFPLAEQERRAHHALQCVGLDSRLQHTPAQLSPGQQQRVVLARALVNNPVLLLADEPTANLDARSHLEMMAMLQALNQRGLTIVMVTQNLDNVLYAKRQLVLHDGLIIHDERVSERKFAHDDLSKNTNALPENKQESTCTAVQVEEEMP